MDSVIYPNVRLRGETTIGANCVIEAFVVLHDTVLGNNTKVGLFSTLSGCCVGDKQNIAPRTDQ